MVYDNTKLNIALKNWMANDCSIGYGEELSADLLTSFENHCRRTTDLKRSPGRVIFGQQLRKLCFEHRKLAGLAYWSGLELNQKPANAKPMIYKKTRDKIRLLEIEKQSALRINDQKKARIYKNKLSRFTETIADENADEFISVGGSIPSGSDPLTD